MPTTVILSDEITQVHKKIHTSHAIYSNSNTHQGYVHFHARTKANDIRIATAHKNKKAFTLPIIPKEENNTNAVDVEDVNYFTDEVQRLL
eukprot:2220630-Ditylum_brightwellii.AAC.1